MGYRADDRNTYGELFPDLPASPLRLTVRPFPRHFYRAEPRYGLYANGRIVATVHSGERDANAIMQAVNERQRIQRLAAKAILCITGYGDGSCVSQNETCEVLDELQRLADEGGATC